MMMLVSAATDSSEPDSPIHFTSTMQDRVSTQKAMLLEPGYLMQLPRGHAFVLMAGGQLYKVQLPELDTPSQRLPSDLDQIANEMERRYQRATGVELRPDDSINRAALWTQSPFVGPEHLPGFNGPSTVPVTPASTQDSAAAPRPTEPPMRWGEESL